MGKILARSQALLKGAMLPVIPPICISRVFRREAAELLVSRKVRGVGLDTASLDYGSSKDFIVHRVLNGAGIYGLENVANLEKVPMTGATLIALPMKIKGGSGGPVRIVALVP